jgi:hypothetical protein
VRAGSDKAVVSTSIRTHAPWAHGAHAPLLAVQHTCCMGHLSQPNACYQHTWNSWLHGVCAGPALSCSRQDNSGHGAEDLQKQFQ